MQQHQLGRVTPAGGVRNLAHRVGGSIAGDVVSNTGRLTLLVACATWRIAWEGRSPAMGCGSTSSAA